MTPQMLEKTRENARKGGYENVEFRLGEIENLPVADSSVDAVILNCVVNLSPDKNRVFAEVFRILSPGGRLMVSDIVLLKELSQSIRDSIEAYIGCVCGVVSKDEYLRIVREAGFRDATIFEEVPFPVEYIANTSMPCCGSGCSHITLEEVEGISHTVRGIRIFGTNP